MRYRLTLVLALVLVAMSGPARAQTPAPGNAPSPALGPAPNAGPVYTITYFEVGPAAAARTVGLLRPFAAATRREDGNQAFLALEEIGRPTRFAIVEAWRDKAAAEAHGAAVGALRDQMQPLFASPFDIRTNSGLSVAGPAVGAEAGAGKRVYVLTHVDVFPAGKDQTIDLLKQLAEASRKEAGNLRFDVLQQDGRANHLPLVEAWRDASAQTAHTMAEHTHGFRAKLVPLQGALYDERLYTALR